MNEALERIRKEEVVQYISERYHVTVDYLLGHLSDLELEDNEIQIIRDLNHRYEE